MSVNAQVVSFAQSRMGNRVGRRGECWDLAEEALRSAGARSSRDLGPVRPDSDYVWGTLIPLSSLQAGDIVQFRNYNLTIRTTTTTSSGGGSWNEQTQSRPHHTAIVAAIGSNGAIEVYEQNVGRRRVVMRNTLYFQSSRSERREGGAVIVTQVTVSGTLWYYRPQARAVQGQP